MKIANKNAREFVKQKKPFQGNNIFAVTLKNGYVVYSYGYHYPMFIYSRLYDKWFINEERYSQTTEKHKTQCMPFIPISNYFGKTTSEMRDLVKKLF